MQCAICKAEFNDGVLCSVCNNHLDFACANILETTWRRYGPEKRSQWRCQSCRAPSPLPTASTSSTLAPSPVVAGTTGAVTLDTIWRELQDVKRQLSSVSGLRDDMQMIKTEMSDLKASCTYACAKMDELFGRVTKVESKVSGLENLRDTVASLQKELAMTKTELSTQDQRTRLNNIEIKGVPVKKEENLFSVFEKICTKVDFAVPKSQVSYISRVPTHNSKEKNIIVSFLNRYIKEDFMTAARVIKFTGEDIGFPGTTSRVYTNDHLSAGQKKLLTMTKTTARAKNHKYVWIKYGKIHVRRDDSSGVILIRNENDLNKFI